MVRILMLGSPPDIETDSVLQAVRVVDGVEDIHHAHFWLMDEHRAALDAHVVVEVGRWADADAVKASVKGMLRERFGIIHSTLELECSRHSCTEASNCASKQKD